ncbi:MAG: hypothetical protein HYZ74_07015 [Elusimicrobia bacterium]|nr:hypothetical protein [Elusimicrobiota bacterium]
MVKTTAKRVAIVCLAVLTCAAVGIQPRRGRERSRERDEAPARAPAPAAAPAAPRQRVGIAPRVETPRVPAPANELAPAAPGSSAAAPPVGIHRREGSENAPHRHYWHHLGGRRYSHYYDGRVHWYGYPRGADFWWTRPYGGYWWLYDGRYARWSYWSNGYWWWPGPGGVQYVFVNDGYYPYETARGLGRYATPVAGEDARGPWTSPDGRRLVEITGPEAQAVLFDKTATPPGYLRFLGAGAQRVRFSTGGAESLPTILVEFAGGGFALFDMDGRRLDANASAPAPSQAPRPPPMGELPPPPP